MYILPSDYLNSKIYKAITKNKNIVYLIEIARKSLYSNISVGVVLENSEEYNEGDLVITKFDQNTKTNEIIEKISKIPNGWLII